MVYSTRDVEEYFKSRAVTHGDWKVCGDMSLPPDTNALSRFYYSHWLHQ